MKSEKRTKKITRALQCRQPDLVVVLENIHDPHNVSAIVRTCDSIGVGDIYLVYNQKIVFGNALHISVHALTLSVGSISIPLKS